MECFCRHPNCARDRKGPWNQVSREQARMGGGVVALESVLDEVRTLLADKVVVGCSIHSDLISPWIMLDAICL